MPSARPRVCIAMPLEADLERTVDAACQASYLGWGGRRPELLAALSGVEGLLISNQVWVNAEIFDAAPALRAVSGFGVGYDRFDISEATKRGIALCNTPEVVTNAVVELTMGLLLVLARRLFPNDTYARRDWARRQVPPALGLDLRGKTLGVIGFGRIGTEVTRRAQAFGMRTVWTDVFDSPPEGAPESVYQPLDDLLQHADFVSMHVDLNPTSHHLIGARELSLMKREAHLLNTSRGPVVDQSALADALESDAIAGAALDVLEREPPEPDERILRLPNTLVFPHIGTSTEQTRRAMRELAVRNLLDMLSGHCPPACLNPEVC